MKVLLPFFIVLFCSCYGQNTTRLTFVNNAKFDIDSIVVLKPARINFEKLSIGQQYSKKVQDVLINTSREGAFPFTVYINGQAFSGTWGFHDFGMLVSTSETFYIFDHGINTTDKPLEKPKDFKAT
jgi:sRNA-binding regulator protein Hfq